MLSSWPQLGILYVFWGYCCWWFFGGSSKKNMRLMSFSFRWNWFIGEKRKRAWNVCVLSFHPFQVRLTCHMRPKITAQNTNIRAWSLHDITTWPCPARPAGVNMALNRSMLSLFGGLLHILLNVAVAFCSLLLVCAVLFLNQKITANCRVDSRHVK